MGFNHRSFKNYLSYLKKKIIYLCMAVLGLDCCVLAFSSCDKQELLFAAGHLTEVASLVAECGL